MLACLPNESSQKPVINNSNRLRSGGWLVKGPAHAERQGAEPLEPRVRLLLARAARLERRPTPSPSVRGSVIVDK